MNKSLMTSRLMTAAGLFVAEEEEGTIPAGVRSLMARRWAADTKYSAFETEWGEGRDRQRHPSYYLYREGDPAHVDGGPNMFSYADAEALIGDRVFGAFAGVYPTHAAINEHAQHALRDFMCAVYAEWEKYQKRLDEIAKRSPLPGEGEP